MAKRKSGARGDRPDRGGGFGGGRGRGNNGRGRGGWAPQGPGRGRGHSHSASNSSMQDELDLDFTLQTYSNAPSPLKPVPAESSASSRGRGFTAFRGRGRGGSLIPMQLAANTAFPGRGRGFDIPRRHVQGIGARRGPVPVGRQTLSNLLQQDRPLLKPIKFVPSTETRFLFQDEEELLQPTVEDVDQTIQSHIPTADRVTRVFSGRNIPPNVWDNDEAGTEDDLEVVDFNDVGKLFQPTASTSKGAIPKRKADSVPVANTVHEVITRNNIRETRPLPAGIEGITERVDKPLSIPNGAHINGNYPFYVDTQPTNGMELTTIQQPSSVLSGNYDDDVIVYVAPHPRNTLRTSGREKESTKDVAEISTTNEDHAPPGGVDASGFSAYERPAALPASVSLESTVSTAGEEPLSSVLPTAFTALHIPELPSSSAALASSRSAPDTEETTNTGTASTTATPPRLRVPPITTPRQAKLWKSKLSRSTKGTKSLRRTPFSAFGSMREEGLLRKLDGERDKRYDERRRGDSDLEWGDTTDGDGEDGVGVSKEVVGMNVPEPQPGLDPDMERVLGMLEKGKEKMGESSKIANHAIDNDHGMEVDVDVDIETLERFAKHLTGSGAGTYVTIDDIECEEIIRMEDEGDEDENQRGSSGDEDGETEGTVDEEEEEALRTEEAKFMPEGELGNIDGRNDEETGDLGEDDDDEEDDEDEDDFEEGSFHVKLNRLRSLGVPTSGEVDDEDSDDLQRDMTSADKDEAFIRYLDAMLEREGDQRHRKKCSTSVDDDDFEHLDWTSSPGGRTGIPPELSIRYELDREKKAKWKRERELKRLAGAAPKKGGRNGRKAMIAAAAEEPTITVLPNRVIDMTTLVQNIRRFIADVGGPFSMSLPPTDKETRKNVHEMALAFNLKSVSKGKGDTRYTTLTKTTRTGIQVNEGKIAKIIRRSVARGGSFMLGDTKGKGVVRVPRHREGDVVGMAAPKLDGSNVGFKLLARMGWSEGDRIGASTNGLEAPLNAIIKTTKLGLGARK